MSHEERNTIVALAMNLALNGYVIYRLIGMYGSGALDGADGPQVLARFLVWMIGIGVAVAIAMAILSAIGAGIASRRYPGAGVVDERDRMFEMRGMAVTTFVAAIGFIAAIAALAWGIRPVTAFVAIYFAFAAGSLAGDIVRLLSYRSEC